MRYLKPTSAKRQKLLERATELAKMSDYSVARHGAIITRNGKTIAVGVNRRVNDPANLTNNKTDVTVHAEIAALNACRKTNLEGAIVYVARVLKDDTPAMSKPCARCQEALKARGVKVVHYTVDSTLELD